MNPLKETTPSREHSTEPVTTHTRNKIVLRANRSTTHKPRNSNNGSGSSTRTYNKRDSKKNKLIKTSKTRDKNNREIINTSKEINESRIIPVEEPPREELPYDKFYPDLKLDEKLVVVYISSKDLAEDQEEKEIKEESTIIEEVNVEITSKAENVLVQTQENSDVIEYNPIFENNIPIPPTPKDDEKIQLEEAEQTNVFLDNHQQEQEMLSSISIDLSIKSSESSIDSFTLLTKNFEEETFKDIEDISSPKDLIEELIEETSSSKTSPPELLTEKPSFIKDDYEEEDEEEEVEEVEEEEEEEEEEDDDDDDTESFKISSHEDIDEETIDEDEQEETPMDLKLPDTNGDVTVDNSVVKEMDWTHTSAILSDEIENGVKKEDIVFAECPSTDIITTVEDNTPTVQSPPVKKLPVPSFKRINFIKEEPDEPFIRPEGHYIRHVGTYINHFYYR
jgi:hypothetical protein